MTVVAAALAISSQLLDSALTTEDGFIVEPESAVAARLTETRLAPAKITELVIVGSETLTVDEPAFREFVGSMTAEISKLVPTHVEGVFDYYVIGNEAMVSEDRHTTIINVVMAGGLDEASENVVHLIEVAREASFTPDIETYVVGPASVDRDFVEVAKRDVLKGEIIGVGIALVILILVFRTVGAAPIPIIMAVVSVIIALALTSLIGQIYRLSFFIVNMITMIGLAVGIDYSLFVVGRFREERAAGLGKREAITKAGATASRAVFFSGITVVLALVGMLVVPASVFFSLGLGAILVAVIAVLAALTLLPAILSLVGDRVNSLRLPFLGGNRRGRGRFWIRITRMVMTRPLLSLALSGGLLVAATAPVLDLNLGALGIETLPDSMASKRGFQILESEFSAGLVSPATIVVDGDVRSEEVQDGIARLTSAIRQDPGYGEPRVQASEAGNLAVISLPFNTERYEGGGVEGVRHLRAELVPNAAIPADVYVGGGAAERTDFRDLAASWTPRVFGFVLGLSFILLMIAFRSLVVPIKAIFMNLLSVGAAYGLLVLVFQRGLGAGLFGFQQVEVIETWIPLLLFTVLFGLSMDYHVFLLSRTRDRSAQTQTNQASLALGLASTAGMITGAALIMVAVFGGFAAGELVMFQQVRIGLTVSVLLDATVIRSILIPASMQLLGKRNWYFPRFLEWLPDVRVEVPKPQAGTASNNNL
ncbi:MAG: MMPL family transporter [Chloroflexi bacterium]|nr:MMPL family transporter [Chloroflexota bacterium]